MDSAQETFLDTVEKLTKKINSRSAKVSIIGMGHVGLPLACVLSKAGFSVTGIDNNKNVIDSINDRSNPILNNEPGILDLFVAGAASEKLKITTSTESISTSDVVTINVDTPIQENKLPEQTNLIRAVTSVGQKLDKDTLVIIESTVAPKTTKEIVIPKLEEVSRKTEGLDFFVGFSPERIMPTLTLKNLYKMPRVCGASKLEISQLMKDFYKIFCEGEIDLTDLTTAETVKVVENTYRDVQIAFANECALICKDLNLRVEIVRELVNKVPFRDMHEPGGGVGGHCIPKDPWLLASAVNIDLDLIPAARKINDKMPSFIADLILESFPKKEPGQSICIAILGYSYRPETGDTRNSPSERLTALLQESGATVKIHDPFVEEYKSSFSETISNVDAIAVMVEHDMYQQIDLHAPLVIRAKNFLITENDVLN